MAVDKKSNNNICDIWGSEPIFSFTVDVDWASEDAIKYCHSILEQHKIRPTYFLTHPSKFLYSLLEGGSINAGIHPNFISGSSHGNSYTEVINYCMHLLPNAECFRSHRYYDVNDITDAFYGLGLRYDSNLCTRFQKVNPFIHRSGLIRFPVYFEDGAYLLHEKSLNFNSVEKKLFSSAGLMVINIHPMHMVLNSPNFSYAQKVKNLLSSKEWNSLTYEDFKKLKYAGLGIRDFLINLFKFVNKNNYKIYTLKELYEIIKIHNYLE
ncbi:polysaccharide deacetylase WbmS family protein [Anaeromicrobium sediminis]|uniref:NodB homology domain-containing protein n=1 Tax=Anaeromicrobium sediminis TaxID=1478221 RepID=A0A267ML98_9FIRM|nr:hypothetical protein [Anaeromicrobium sediminis]PAB59573.1 hypothetical protein CCE28_10195 [Anaeromicrobium sediminis]